MSKYFVCKNQPNQNAILRTSNFALYLLYLFSQYLLLLVVVNAVKVDYNQHYRCQYHGYDFIALVSSKLVDIPKNADLWRI